jgi:dihydroflavonol-4-reductase
VYNLIPSQLFLSYICTMIFVTGGTGLLGSHLLLTLTATEDRITSTYRSEAKKKYVFNLFQKFLGEQANDRFSKISWVKCEVLDVVELEEAMRGHTHVYHCAALVSFLKKDFQRLIEVNRYGTANVVNVCLSLGIQKLCYVSSTAAAGSKGILKGELIDENTPFEIDENTSGYSISKYSAEKEVWRGIEEGLNAVIVNPSVIIGPGNWNESSLVIFRTINNGLRFYSPGANAFVDVRDVVKAMIHLMNSDVRNERFLCTGHNLPFRTLFNLIAKQLGKKPPRYPVSPVLMGFAWRISAVVSALTFRSPAITRSSAQSAFNEKQYDSSKLMRTLDFQFTPIEESVQHAVEGRVG